MSLKPIFLTLFLTALSSLWGSHVWAVACPTSSTLATVNSPCTVSGSQSTFELNFITGFTDATALVAVDGNPGTTIGSQRQYAFIKAAEILAEKISSTETLVVDASFTTLTCNATTAVLGSAGASNNFSFPSPPAGITANTFYPIGLINAISQTDKDLTAGDITAEFNKNVGNTGCLQASDGWYYGFGTPAVNDIGFTTVLLHELTHGLGFASLVDPSSGAKASGTDDVFSNLLFDASLGAWPALNDSQRAASAKSSTSLLWNGSNVNTNAAGLVSDGFNDADSSGDFNSGDKVQMYAPSPVEGGSSISHFNTSVAPNELMEPEYTEGQYVLGLALYLLQDLGWSINEVSTPAVNNPPTITAIDQTTQEDTPLTLDISSWGQDADGDTLSYSVTSCASNITCDISSNSLTLTPALNHHGTSHNITIEVSDGEGGTATDSFNLQVSAVNDDPTWSSIPNQNLELGSSLNINLASFSDDVDADSLSYSATTCPSALTCLIDASTLNLTANAGAGTVVAVEVQANDNQGGSTSQSFNLLILAPALVQVADTTFSDGDTLTLNLDDGNIAISGGSGQFSYDLSFLGQDVSSLISSSLTGLTLELPSTGAFAGVYTLEISDDNTGNITTLTINRPPRLVLSNGSMLNSDNGQTLTIEGGVIGSTYSLSQSLSQSPSNPLIFMDSSGNPQTSFNASDNASLFNPAVIGIQSETVTELTQITIGVSALNQPYPDTEKSLLLYPVLSHTFTVQDEDGAGISDVTAALAGNARLTELGITLQHSVSNNGQLSLNLPNLNEDYEITFSATNFNPSTLTLNNSQAEHLITLSSTINAIVLSGTVRALGEQDFLATPPVLLLTFEGGGNESITVTSDTTSKASFSHQVDINLHTLKAIELNQDDSVSLEFDVSEVIQNKSFDILLESTLPVNSTPASFGSSGGGGMPFSLLLLIALLVSNRAIQGDDTKGLY